MKEKWKPAIGDRVRLSRLALSRVPDRRASWEKRVGKIVGHSRYGFLRVVWDGNSETYFRRYAPEELHPVLRSG